MFDIDWYHTLAPQTPLLEIFLRGTITYLGLFLLLRLILKRESGMVGITDLLVVVLLADASQNAMADDYRSITDGLFLILTIIFWSYLLNWLGFRFPSIQRFVHPPPLQLVRDGHMVKRNMRKEFITDDELYSMMRAQGIDDLAQVKAAYMEGDGQISVITKDGRPTRQQASKGI